MPIQTNLAIFNAAFTQYAEQWTARGHGTLEDALEKKGRDLGIKLFQGFRAHKWGGAGKAPKDLARTELDARVAEGKGIRVRFTLMQEYLAERSKLREKYRGKHNHRGTMAKISLWQKFVGKELALRQSGIGVLAAAFLWYRSRSNNAQGTFYVRNKVGRPIGGVIRGDGTFRIVGDIEGLSEVDVRYGIVQQSLRTVEVDMLTYLAQRNNEMVKQFFSAFSKGD